MPRDPTDQLIWQAQSNAMQKKKEISCQIALLLLKSYRIQETQTITIQEQDIETTEQMLTIVSSGIYSEKLQITI